MNKPNVEANNIIGGLIIMVLLNWFSKAHENLKFKDDVINIIEWTLIPLYLLSP